MLKKFNIVLFIGIFVQLSTLFVVPLNVNGQNTTESIPTKDLSGVIILDNGGLQPYFSSFCIYESQIYTYGARIDMDGIAKTCMGNYWQ